MIGRSDPSSRLAPETVEYGNGNKWDVFYVEVRHVVRVEVLAGVYNNPSEANADPDFQEYLTSPMELCDINGWSVITDGRQIERLDSYGPGPWTLTAIHHSRQHRSDGAS